jgi:methylmalonyl-CoA mutase
MTEVLIEVKNTAIQEDANAIALTSYQGGHNEYFKYMICLRKGQLTNFLVVEAGLFTKIAELQDYGITRICTR